MITSENTEEKMSLIINLKSDFDEDSTIATSTGNFINKIPIEDRNKYEKLRSNDNPTSDDSDSEFFNEDYSSKAAYLKHIVTNNIPDKIHKIQQAAYNKVDKTQIKVPIVRKLRTNRKELKNNHQQDKNKINLGVITSVALEQGGKNEKENNLNNPKKCDDNDDADSIGSASDLRAEDDDYFDENNMNSANRFRKQSEGTKGLGLVADDGISESVKTCSSSAYHAECESVTTHEDDVSRVVVKVRMKKRDRMMINNDTAATLMNENQLSPGSNDFLHKFGDRPLLLDDELDYSDSDSKEKSEDSPQLTPVSEGIQIKPKEVAAIADDFDVFAMAPFKMPTGQPKKKKKSSVNRQESIEIAKRNEEKLRDEQIWTSTPKKVDADKMENKFATYLAPAQKTSEKNVETKFLDEFNEPIFNPFIEGVTTIQSNEQLFTHQLKPIQSSSNFGVVTIVSSFPSIDPPPPPQNQQQSQRNNQSQRPNQQQSNCDLFGSEPFPQILAASVTAPVSTKNLEFNNNSIQHKYIKRTDITAEPIKLVTVNHSIIINKTPEPQQAHIFQLTTIGSNNIPTAAAPSMTSSSSSAANTFINYSNISLKNQHDFVPMADNEYISIAHDEMSDFTPDDEEEPVVIGGGGGNTGISNIKYKKEKSLGVRTLPAKLSQKVKSNVASYKKVPSTGSKNKNKYQQNIEQMNNSGNGYFQSNTIQNSKAGFSNMSFEDFPSDQEIDRMSKTIPFEVVRNEKMIVEAEKKFGSLKRRNNLFS